MKLTLLALTALLAGASFASPMTCQGTGVYCNSMQPEYEGMLMQNSNGTRGLISWLWPWAESDFTVYDGPVVVVDPSDFYVPGIYGMFTLWVDPPTVTLDSDGDDHHHSMAPEPATWGVCLMGAGVLLFAGRFRQRQ